MRVTYRQDWPAYNAAQVHERELCDAIPQPPQKMGRPRLPLSDMVFAAGTKVYSTMSGRRAMTDVRNAQASGQLDKTPSFTSIFRYLEKPELAPLRKSLNYYHKRSNVETTFSMIKAKFGASWEALREDTCFSIVINPSFLIN